MKKERECKSCHADYDVFLKKCPFCNEDNDTFPLDEKFSKMLFLNDTKLLLLFLIGFLCLYGVSFIFALIYKNLPSEKSLKLALTNFSSYLVILVALIFVVGKDYKLFIPGFKKIRPLIAALLGLAACIAFSFIYSGILSAAGVSIATSENQKQLEAMVRAWPALAFFTIVIFGPIVEELAYRMGLFGVLRKRNRLLAYGIEVILFAFLHLNFMDLGNPNEWLNFPIYLVPGFVLTGLYEYEGFNASLYAHILNNLFSFIITMVVR